MVGTEALTVDQVAGMLNLSRNTVYKMAKDGTLPSYRVGRKLRFSQSAIQSHLNATATFQSGTTSPRIEGLPLEAVAASLANESAPRLVISGEDALIGTITHHLGANGVPADCLHTSSYAALVNLYCGNAEMALISLYDQRTNNYNIPYVQRLCPGMSVIVFRIARRQRGLIVRADNPRRIRTWSSLANDNVRVTPHEKGTGKRVLLDQMMLAIEERPVYDLAPAPSGVNHERVAEGAADVCIGSEEDAKSHRGLTFIPLQTEMLDLVVRKTPETRAAIRTLRALCAEQSFRDAIAFGGNDTSTCGAITYDC